MKISVSSRSRFVLFMAVATVLAALAIESFAQRASFQGQASVVVVEVPVTVTRDGEPLRNLTKDNFEIVDGGKKQELIGFEMVDLTTVLPSLQSAAEDAKVPQAARRHFLLLFDLANSIPSSIIKAREGGLQLLDTLHHTDVAAVAIYSNTGGVNFILGFTSDRRQIELALETLGVPDLFERAPDPLQLFLGDLPEAGGIINSSDGPGRGVGNEAANEAAQETLLSALETLANVQRTETARRIKALTEDFTQMAGVLSNIEGQKHVVYFSEGFSSQVLLGSGGDSQETRASAESGEIWNVGSDSRFGNTSSLNDLEDMIEAFRRSGATVQSVDIGGLRGANDVQGRVDGSDGLNAMAKDTGGAYYDNFNDLGAAMGQMLESTSVTYLLAFSPRGLKQDGKYHRIKVKLKNAPRARLSHRAGYYGPKPLGEVTAVEKQIDTSQLILSGEDGGPIGVDILATPMEVRGEIPYVPLLVEVDGVSLLEAQSGNVVQVELFAYAFDQVGGVGDFFTQTLGLDLAKVGPGLRQNGLKYWGHMDLLPGKYSVRVLIRNSSTGRYTLRNVALDVPAYDSAGAQLLPPMFPEEQGKWVLIREPSTRQRDVDYPFMAVDQPFIPAAKPVLAPKGKSPFYLKAVNLPAGIEFEAAVMTVDGGAVNGGKVMVGPVQPAGDGIQTASGELETEGLPPGEYQLVVKVKGNPSHSNKIVFVVG